MRTLLLLSLLLLSFGARADDGPVPPFGFADHLEFAVQPNDVGGIGRGPWTSQPVIRVVDRDGNVVLSDNSSIIAIDCVAPLTVPSCQLGGTSMLSVVNGVASFSDLRVLQEGPLSGVAIRAQASPSLTPVISQSFDQN